MADATMAEPMQKAAMITHINEHVQYPATKAELVAACNNMDDIPEEDKRWFMENLPEGAYNSPDEVKQALNLV